MVDYDELFRRRTVEFQREHGLTAVVVTDAATRQALLEVAQASVAGTKSSEEGSRRSSR